MTQISLRRLLAPALLVFGAISCGDGGPTAPSSPSEPVALAVPAGSAQTDTVGHHLSKPVGVLVTGASGSPVSGVDVTFSVTQGGGTVSSASVRSGADGYARTVWTLGTVTGTQTLTAQVAGVSAPVLLTARARPGAPVAVVKVRGDQTAPVNALLVVPLQVRVTDGYGNPADSVSVFWIADPSVGTVVPAVTLTDSTGVATTRWRSGDAQGALHVSARVAGLPDVVFNGTIVSPSALFPDSLVMSGGNNQSAMVSSSPASPLSVRVATKDGYPVQNVAIHWAVRQGGGRVLPAEGVTNADGFATTIVQFGPTFGPQRIVATASGMKDSVVFSGLTLAGSPTDLVRVSGDAQSGVVGTALVNPLVAAVHDANGNPIAGVTVTWAVTSGGGTLSATTTATDTLGNAQVTWKLGTTAGAQTVEARAGTLAGSPLTFSATAHAATGSGALLATVSGNAQRFVAGGLLGSPLVVKATDSFGNPMDGVDVVWSCPSCARTGGVLGTPTGKTDLSGLASITLTLGSATDTVVATGNGVSQVFVETVVAASISLSSGDNQGGVVGRTLANPLVARVTETATGTPIVGAPVTFTVTQGDGTVTPTQVVTDASGGATTKHLLRSTLGPDVVRASLTGNGGASVFFTSTPTGPLGEARMESVSGDGQIGTAGDSLPRAFVVRVLSASGVPVRGVYVHWRLLSAHGVLSVDSSQTNAAGLDSVRAILPIAVSDTLRAGASINVLAAQVVFTATSVRSSVPASLTMVAGDGQGGRTDTTLAAPLVVRVTDAGGLGLRGVQVSWSVDPTQGGSVTSAVTVTDSTGRASVGRVLGHVLGTYTTRASLSAFPAVAAVVFTSTATTTNAPALVQTLSAASVTEMAGSDSLERLTVSVLDAGHVPVPNVTVTWSVTAGGALLGTTGQGTTVTTVTDAFGQTSIVARAGTVVGSSTIQAVVPGATSAVFTFVATGAPASLVKTAATDNQTVAPGGIPPLPLTVTVLDGAGRPVHHAHVLFTIQNGGGGGFYTLEDVSSGRAGAGGNVQPFISMLTDANGRAAVYRVVGAAGTNAQTTVSMPDNATVPTVIFITTTR